MTDQAYDEITALRARIAELENTQAEHDSLRAYVAQLEDDNADLALENAQLRKQLAEGKDQPSE